MIGTQGVEVLLIAALGASPLVALPLGRRRIAWLLLALVPLHLYLKSFFLTVEFGSREVQWSTLSKDLAFFVLLAASLLAWLLRDPRRWWRWTWRLVIATVVLAALSLAAGAGVGATILGLRLYLFWPAVGILVGRLLLRTPADVRRFITVLVAGAACVACVGLIQAYVDDRFLIHPAMRQLWAGNVVEWFTFRERLRGPFTSANTLALVMGTGVLGSVAILLGPARDGRLSMIAAALVPAMLWVMFLSQSRTALIATGLGLCVMGARREAGVVRRGALALSVVLAATAGYLFGLQDRFTNLLANPRLVYWAAFLAATASSPRTLLTGQGMGAIGRYGVETQTSSVASIDLEGVTGGEGLFFVDSVYIRSVFELGVLGLVPMVFLWWAAFRLIRSGRAPRPHAWASEARASLLVFLLVASILTETLLTYPWNVIAWALATANVRTDMPTKGGDRGG